MGWGRALPLPVQQGSCAVSGRVATRRTCWQHACDGAGRYLAMRLVCEHLGHCVLATLLRIADRHAQRE